MNTKATKDTQKGAEFVSARTSTKGIRGLVRRFARGNVNLQVGRYASRQEIERRRKAVTEFNFAE